MTEIRVGRVVLVCALAAVMGFALGSVGYALLGATMPFLTITLINVAVAFGCGFAGAIVLRPWWYTAPRPTVARTEDRL